MKIYLISIVLAFGTMTSFAEEIPGSKVDIRGKILNEDGSIFSQSVEVMVDTAIFGNDEKGQYIRHPKYYHDTNTGAFDIKTTSSGNISITANKEGYRSTEVCVLDNDECEYYAKDILIYMIPKGAPSILKYTEDAYIPDIDEEESNGKPCGWSFQKRWYYPVDEEDVDITLGVNEKGQYYYRMKSPGGFVPYPGFKEFESKDDIVDCKIEFLHEAPEEGYVQDFILDDYPPTMQGWNFCYFRTPDGKYGKAIFWGAYFSYYINPNGSRNLELGERIDMTPARPWER